jgi:hypothetical protein
MYLSNTKVLRSYWRVSWEKEWRSFVLMAALDSSFAGHSNSGKPFGIIVKKRIFCTKTDLQHVDWL